MFRDLLVSEWAPFGHLSEDQLTKLERHYELLIRWNKTLNLTRIERLEDVVRLHYCESMFLGLALPSGPQCIADVGSGAGFPGIPIAIQRPECEITLVEAHQRKAVFLSEVSEGISGAKVLQRRAESIDGPYDWLVSRAVAPVSVLSLGLAQSIAILTSEADLRQLPGSVRVIPVPWGKQRVVALFHVEHQSAKI
jgi:16S rRNA (guanine(527)-N(7))-methyltransferase RsmG